MKINPVALLIIALATLIGLAAGSWLIGAIVGCSVVLLASVLS